MNIRRLSDADADFERQLDALCVGAATPSPQVTQTVGEIIERVRAQGDAALLDYTREFDGVDVGRVADLRVARAAISGAWDNLDGDLRDALKRAAERIRHYAEKQSLNEWELEGDGVTAKQRVTPLDSVGIYAPGGGASYPSSVLMNAIPAQVAGVRRIVLTVPAHRGELNAVVLAAIALCEIEEVWMIGGAQAVAALAYGCESIAPVDKVVGPGNAYVAEAKRQVFGQVGIDTIAGPSEVVIVSDGQSRAEWIAADLLAQAEHDENARAIFVCTDGDLIGRVAAEMRTMLAQQPRREIIESALKQNGCLIQVADMEGAMDVVNRIAPEHLGLSFEGADEWVAKVRNAGAIFVGVNASEVLGDYCAGPNHVLPTGGAARYASPLGVYAFQKRSSVVSCTASAAAELGEIANQIAVAEGLHAHAAAAKHRSQLS